jgi:hypothetical protein
LKIIDIYDNDINKMIKLNNERKDKIFNLSIENERKSKKIVLLNKRLDEVIE